MELKQMALSYADLHFAVFPLSPKDKRPAIAEWNKHATTNKVVIEKWWDENPLYNIGIATGLPSGGLIVVDLDIDDEKGKNGIERLNKWQNDYGVHIPFNTATARSGRGGVHIFYRDADTVYRNAADLFKDGSGVDVRANGGYIVAPGSVHPNGTPYEWINHPLVFGIAQADAAVKALLSPTDKSSADPFKSPDVIGEGERNSALFKLASSMVAKGLSREAILAAVIAENDTKCVPPLDASEVETIVNSAWRYPNGTSPYNNAVSKTNTDKLSTDMVTLSAAEEKDPEWLIDGYIPRREITIIAGDGGTGKSFTWCALAAAVSTGYKSFLQNNLFADAPDMAPGKVLFFSSEDSYEYVLRRRLRKNGANLDNIKTLDCADDRFHAVTLNSDYLEKLIAAHRPALCIFDPIQAFVGGANMISRSEMRECMKRLHTYGEKYGTTFLLIMHTNKMQSVWGRNRLSDSSDIWDIARSVMIAGKADENGLRYLSHEKSNYGPQCKTVLFRILDETVTFQNYTDKRDREFVLEASKIARETPATDEAENFIISYLEEQGGSGDVKNLDNAAAACGIKNNAIKTAKQRLKTAGKIKIESTSRGQGKGFTWRVFLHPC